MKRSIAFRVLLLLMLTLPIVRCQSISGEETVYSYETFPLNRNGISLHLDCVMIGNDVPTGHILLIHGSSYSSHEFDVDYQDYSLVRRLAR